MSLMPSILLLFSDQLYELTCNCFQPKYMSEPFIGSNCINNEMFCVCANQNDAIVCEDMLRFLVM